ncbi:MAG: ribbon-helix-helix protein, CopG family [Aquabacterium sp.]|jgi:CopG family transcriptional regulator, nickel-responsive regulator|uniref:ribbon-helix-helix protein, CopG family n=1 Tax=Aquabacterium sp. TaxID=1872578 RepID=UPI003BB0B59F
MQRPASSIDDELAEQFECWSERKGYDNRSEAFRDLLRRELGDEPIQSDPLSPCVATLTYLYDHMSARYCRA